MIRRVDRTKLKQRLTELFPVFLARIPVIEKIRISTNIHDRMRGLRLAILNVLFLRGEQFADSSFPIISVKNLGNILCC